MRTSGLNRVKKIKSIMKSAWLRGYLRWGWFCLCDLQALREHLLLWDGRQCGRGSLHHLQGLLGDLNHLGVRFGLDHLNLLHHSRLSRTLNDQQIVTCLQMRTKR